VSETYSEEEYYNQNTDESGDTGSLEEVPPARSRMISVALIAAVLACSCLSCLIGAGLGIVAWDEFNAPVQASPTRGASATRQAQPDTVRVLQSQDVVDAFVAAGLECEDPQPITGRIYIFDNPAELQQARTYYTRLGQDDPNRASWLFVKDNVLVQISGGVPQDQARAYGNALRQL
jgi:hypothetical protein